MLSLAVCTAGCQQEMEDQPHIEPLEASSAFEFNMSARHLVTGTIPRGTRIDAPLSYDPEFTSAKSGGEFVDQLPQRMLDDRSLEEVLARGRERYGIFCAHCHALTGSGDGIVPLRGFPYPPSYHTERLRNVPIGYFFDVITNGKGRMAAHDKLVPVEDRWAISAYIRALQYSQYAPADGLPEEDREQLPQPGT